MTESILIEYKENAMNTDAQNQYPSEMPKLTVPVSDRDHVQGPATASVTLVEYGDYECPYCAAGHPVVKEIQRQMGPRLRFAFPHFPSPSIHPHPSHPPKHPEAPPPQA